MDGCSSYWLINKSKEKTTNSMFYIAQKKGYLNVMINSLNKILVSIFCDR